MSGAKGLMGWRLYARIARLLIDQPSTAAEVVEALGVTLVTCRMLLRRMHSLGLVHVVDWPMSPVRHLRVARWAFGRGVDATPPARAKGGAGVRLQPTAEMITFSVMLRELSHGPCTSVMLAEYCGTNRDWTAKFLKYMHGLGLVRIADWARPMRSGSPSQMFAFAPHGGRDAPRPPRMSRKVIDQRNWAKKKARIQQQELLRALAPNASIFRQAA